MSIDVQFIVSLHWNGARPPSNATVHGRMQRPRRKRAQQILPEVACPSPSPSTYTALHGVWDTDVVKMPGKAYTTCCQQWSTFFFLNITAPSRTSIVGSYTAAGVSQKLTMRLGMRAGCTRVVPCHMGRHLSPSLSDHVGAGSSAWQRFSSFFFLFVRSYWQSLIFFSTGQDLQLRAFTHIAPPSACLFCSKRSKTLVTPSPSTNWTERGKSIGPLLTVETNWKKALDAI